MKFGKQDLQFVIKTTITITLVTFITVVLLEYLLPLKYKPSSIFAPKQATLVFNNQATGIERPPYITLESIATPTQQIYTNSIYPGLIISHSSDWKPSLDQEINPPIVTSTIAFTQNKATLKFFLINNILANQNPECFTKSDHIITSLDDKWFRIFYSKGQNLGHAYNIKSNFSFAGDSDFQSSLANYNILKKTSYTQAEILACEKPTSLHFIANIPSVFPNYGDNKAAILKKITLTSLDPISQLDINRADLVVKSLSYKEIQYIPTQNPLDEL